MSDSVTGLAIELCSNSVWTLIAENIGKCFDVFNNVTQTCTLPGCYVMADHTKDGVQLPGILLQDLVPCFLVLPRKFPLFISHSLLVLLLLLPPLD